jgi:hypothetical protein
MKCFLPALLAATMLSGLSAAAQDLSFSANDALQMPKDTYFGEAAGVATNSKGDIFLFQRSGQPTVSLGGSRAFAHTGAQMLKFNSSGKYTGEIGKNLYGFLVPQSVRIDAKDNIWAVDNYSGMVMEFDPTGNRILMTMGRKPESIDIPEGPPRPPRNGALPGAGAQQDLFDSAADVAWDAQGNIFVADGIGNSARVAKFTPDGVFVKSFGSKGADNDKLAGASSVQVDASGNVYVADPGNHRIQVLDNNLNYKSSITGVGDPSALCISPGAHQYLYASDSNPVDNLDKGGTIYKLELSGSVAGKFGHAGKKSGEFGTVNEIDCRSPNTLYVGEVGNYRVQKITLRSAPPA